MEQRITDLTEISIDGFQIVSGNMFTRVAKKNKPICTINPHSVSFSKTSVISLNSCDHIIMRVSSKDRCILISPAPSTDRDSISWVKDPTHIRARKMECRPLTSKLYSSWGLESDQSYRAYGRIVTADNKIMLLFDFRSPEHWKNKVKAEEINNG